MIQHFPTSKPAQEVDDLVNEWSAGEQEIIAVEVFDAPESHHSNKLDTVVGPWVVGPPDEVYAWLEKMGYEDFAVQYELGPIKEDS